MNGMTAGAQDALERTYSRADRIARHEQDLKTEFITAFFKGGATVVQTPGFGVQSMPINEVVSDLFAGANGERYLCELMAVAARPGVAAACGHHTKLITEMAAEYAAFHAGEDE
jgi:hypothetical protein